MLATGDYLIACAKHTCAGNGSCQDSRELICVAVNGSFEVVGYFHDLILCNLCTLFYWKGLGPKLLSIRKAIVAIPCVVQWCNKSLTEQDIVKGRERGKLCHKSHYEELTGKISGLIKISISY